MDAQGSVANAKEDTRYLGAPLTFGAVYRYSAKNLTYLNETTDAATLGVSGDVTLTQSNTNAQAGDLYYFGRSATFARILLHINTAWAGTQTITWEYWDGSSWSALGGVTDTTSSLSLTGAGSVTFTVPGDWATTTVNGSGSLYFARYRVSSFTSQTSPAIGRYAIAGLTEVDQSQHGTDLTEYALGQAYETSSARTALDTRVEYYARCVVTAAEVDLVFAAAHNAAITDITYAIGTTSSGELTVISGAAVSLWTSATTVPAGDISFAFSTRPNPDTTGASNAQLGEVVAYDHTAGAIIELAQFTHAVPTASAAYTFSAGGLWNGAAMTKTPATPPSIIRVSAGWHPHVEFAEDWVAARTAYAGTLADTITEPVGPRPVSSGLGDSGRFVGRPQVGYAAALAKAVQRRCWSPLVNEVFSDAGPLSTGAIPAAQYTAPAPGSAAYEVLVQTTRWEPVPSGATYAWVRVHVRSYVTAGAAVPIGIRCYAMNRPPATTQIGQQPAPALDYAWRGATLEVDHTSTGTGEWLTLGLTRLPVFATQPGSWKGTVHLCLAYAIDPASTSANDANARIEFNAWHVRPVYEQGVGGFA